MTPEFTCNICRKTFDNSRSRTRHVSYCRRKSRNPPKPRKKACSGCTQAKTQCDMGFPACSRCIHKNIVCRYQNTLNVQGRPQEQDSIPLLSSASIPLLGSITDTSLSLWPPYVDDFDFQNSALPIVDILLLDQGLYDFLNIYQPAPRVPRLFQPKQRSFGESSLDRHYVLVSLSSYPRMVLSRKKDDIPPFVHAKYLATSDREFAPKPLARCAGIVALWSVKTKDNSVHIWRAIRSEQERIFEECLGYNGTDLVAAAQAICVYNILRVLEKDDDVTDFDMPLVLTTLKVARLIGYPSVGHSHHPSAQNSQNSQPIWENWVIDESGRRAIYILLIVMSLFDISPAIDYNSCRCAEYLSQIPLPSPKKVWNSRTEAEWVKESVQSSCDDQRHQSLTFGDLLSRRNGKHEIDWHSNDNPTVRESTLDHWLAGVDGMGVLVMSAAKISEDTFFANSFFNLKASR